MRVHALVLAFLLATSAAFALQPLQTTSSDERAALHLGSDWALIAPHLPDPATASAKELELAGDVLMARRFPEDALDYYQYAMRRGGNEAVLLKKTGVARLELQQHALARAIFLHCVQISRKDAQAWNNLGATDYSTGAFVSAIGEYKRAVKLDKQSAVFHANLGMAYVEVKDMDSARAQFAQALKLDPAILNSRERGGVTLRVLQSRNYALLCFEMARMYATQGKIAAMKEWLQNASERGLDLREEMNADAALRPWLKDPEVIVMLANAENFHKRAVATAVPSLGAANDAAGIPN